MTSNVIVITVHSIDKKTELLLKLLQYEDQGSSKNASIISHFNTSISTLDKQVVATELNIGYMKNEVALMLERKAEDAGAWGKGVFFSIICFFSYFNCSYFP
ncbi:MAG: hypothetical protein GY874_14960 [Desulfobacteraceae bacterium]|nr:hypothetical protein [Desulfobacteraceae bacterium]